MNVLGNDINKVITKLINVKPPELLWIKIYGESGSGKTTLAQCVYDDFEVSHHFEMRAWFTVGTSMKARDVLESLLYSLTSGRLTKKTIARMDPIQLSSSVCVELDKKRWLIVLDDVCSSNDIWEQGLKSAFAFAEKHDKGSRIIVTSWKDLKGYKLKPESQHEFQHVMKPLKRQQKQELFKHRYSQLRDAALQVTRRPDVDNICSFSDLPLGIVVLASVLKGKIPENKKLKKIEQIWDILPDYLMRCLRYLQQFPPDKWISVEKLCLLWMAEGMVTQNSGNELEVAKNYCNELIASSLVIEEEQNPCLSVSSQRFVSCKLRRSILEDSSSANYVNITDYSNRKRLSIYLDKIGDKNFSEAEEGKLIDKIKNDLSGEKDATLIKSILFFGVKTEKKSGNKDPNQKKRADQTASIVIELEKFKSTEVLDFNGVTFPEEGMGWHIKKLGGLKYLSFRGCHLKELPSTIKNLKTSLETLDLRVVCKMDIPDELGKLLKLRHLYFPQVFGTKNPKSKLKLRALEHLEILENFDAGKCDSEDLKELEKLRRLTCIGVEKEADLKNILNAINRYQHLDTSLVVNLKEQPKEDVVKKLFTCKVIHILDIQGYIGKLPTNNVEIGSNFTEMVLKKSGLVKCHLGLLENLPNLKSLVLCDNAIEFKDNKMVFQGQFFPNLTSLKLEDFRSLKNLEVKEAASSKLVVLTINKCPKLIGLPCDDLAEMKHLKKLITGGEYPKEIETINKKRKEKGILSSVATT